MAKFLNTSRAYAEIEDITSKANRELVLISPYIKIPARFLERLKDVARKNIRIILVCREKDLRPEEKRDLIQVRNLELRYLKSLHAKCFYNEESMVITSLNLYESSQDNREMGILLGLKEDHELFLEAREEAEFIVRSADLTRDDVATLDTTQREETRQEPKIGKRDKKKTGNIFTKDIREILNTPIFGSKQKGYCLRGGESIPYDRDNPFCAVHFAKWEEHRNLEYKEHYCHLCGKKYRTSMKYPLCRSCYEKVNKQT